MWWMFVCTFIQRFWIAVAKCKSIQQYLKVLEIVSVPHTCTHTLSAHKCTSQMYGQCDDSAYVWNTSSTSFRISRHLDSTFHKILHKYHTQKKERMTLFEHSHRFHILFKLKLCILSAGFFFGKKYFSWIWLRVLIARSKRHTFSVVGHSSVSLYLVGNFSFYLTMSSNLFFISSSFLTAIALSQQSSFFKLFLQTLSLQLLHPIFFPISF